MNGVTNMSECTGCGREYPSILEAALCSDIDASEYESRVNGTVYRSAD